MSSKLKQRCFPHSWPSCTATATRSDLFRLPLRPWSRTRNTWRSALRGWRRNWLQPKTPSTCPPVNAHLFHVPVPSCDARHHKRWSVLSCRWCGFRAAQRGQGNCREPGVVVSACVAAVAKAVNSCGMLVKSSCPLSCITFAAFSAPAVGWWQALSSSQRCGRSFQDDLYCIIFVGNELCAV